MAYVDVTEPSGLGQVSVRRFPGCTLTPRFARRITRGPRRSELSGLSRVREGAAPLRMPAPPPPVPVGMPAIRPLVTLTRPPTLIIPEAIAPALVLQRREALLPSIVARLKPVVMPAIKPAIGPLVTVTPPPVKPILVRPPPTLRDEVFARKKFIASQRAPSGATYESTTVTVVPGADPTARKFTGAGAPLTGQTVSLKESDPIVPVMPSKDGISLVDVAAPEVPSTFVEAAAVEPSPFLKYGILAIGAYILYDSFVKSKPKRKRRRR